MPPSLPAAAALILGCVLAAACSPAFDWREVRPDATGLIAMLPCKPGKGERKVPLAGRQVDMRVLACDTGGATFVIMWGDLGQPALGADALAQWQRAMQGHLRAGITSRRALVPAGALALPQSELVTLAGQRPDGGRIEARLAYFARANQVFQVAVYSESLRPDWDQPLFQALRFGP